MSFYKVLENLDYEDIKKRIYGKTQTDVLKALNKRTMNHDDFAALVSPAADAYLEVMANRAQEESLKYFGKSIVLYTPMYLANYCVNSVCTVDLIMPTILEDES